MAREEFTNVKPLLRKIRSVLETYSVILLQQEDKIHYSDSKRHFHEICGFHNKGGEAARNLPSGHRHFLWERCRHFAHASLLFVRCSKISGKKHFCNPWIHVVIKVNDNFRNFRPYCFEASKKLKYVKKRRVKTLLRINNKD